MRDLNEYKNEIFRRSNERIARRRRLTRQWIGIGVSLCLCLIIGSVLFLPKLFLKIDGGGMVYDNDSANGRGETVDGSAHSLYADQLVGDADDVMEPEAGSSENNLSAMQELKKSMGYGSIALHLPSDWKYEWKEEQGSFNLRIAPKSAPEGWLRIEYSDAFGVCGTGLETKRIQLGSYEAEQGTYDNAPIWDYLHLVGTPGAYTIYTENVGSWWSEYQAEAMVILRGLQVGEGIIHEAEAVRIAKGHYKGAKQEIYADFKSDMGCWMVCFYEGGFSMEKSDTVTLDPKGALISVKEGK